MSIRTCPKCERPMPDQSRADGLCPACLLGADTAESTDATKLIDRSPNIGVPEALENAFTGLEISEQIGRGGMGSVYKARQTKLDRDVAVKVMSRALSESAEFQERFTREAKTLARLSHPNVVSIYDYGEADGHLYLVMEYIDGCNLRQYLQQEPLSPDRALAIIPQICDALDYAHGKGVVHRDIKPENIILARDGKVHIADFGIAKLLDAGADDATLTLTNQAIGSRNYMAPEQIEHAGQVDERADIYSLGVVLYEMLTGELPIGRFAPPSHKSDVDERVDNVVLKSLEKDPNDRYSQVAEVQTDVESIKRSSKANTADGKPKRKAQPETPSIRYSKTAVAAFVMIAPPLFVSGLWLILMPTSFGLFMGLQRIDHWHLTAFHATMMALGLLGLSCTAISVVLGNLAVARIRREPTRLTGMGLAVTAIVFYPLLFLNSTICIACASLETWSGLPVSLLIPIGLFISLIMDLLIIRTIWQKATATLHPLTTAIDNDQRQDEANNCTSNPQQSKTPSRMAITGVILIPIGLLLFIVPHIFGNLMRGYFAVSPMVIDGETHYVYQISKTVEVTINVIGFILTALGLLVSVLSVSLGGVAIAKIRGARGQIRGIGHAITATLFFPFLIFDMAVVTFYSGVTLPAAEHHPSEILAVCAGLAIVNILGAWLTWRIASQQPRQICARAI